MNLVIDLGNTYGKIAVCEGTDIIEHAASSSISNREIAYFLKAYTPLDGAIISSVVNHSRELIDYLGSDISTVLELNSSTPLPITNLYRTPESLGLDRIAAVVGAHTLYPSTNVLAIDAGTAITFDLINKKGEYVGGNISPGLKMRFRALHKFTSKLPHLEMKEEAVRPLGTSTEEAIISGVFAGIVHEINGYIAKIGKDFPGLQVVLTGGDAKTFDKQLKSSIFVVSHLNLIGLNRILDYNAQKKFEN